MLGFPLRIEVKPNTDSCDRPGGRQDDALDDRGGAVQGEGVGDQLERWEAEEIERRRKQDEHFRVQAYEESRRQLIAITERWAFAGRMEEFFDTATQKATNLDEHRRAAMEARIALARKMLGSTDVAALLLAWKSPEERMPPPSPGAGPSTSSCWPALLS